AHPAGTHRRPGSADDPYRVIRQRPAAADDRLDPQRPLARRERRREHVLRQAVAREKARVAESNAAKLLGERGEGRGVNRLAAASGDAPARQVESFEIAGPHAPDAEFVREGRREADGAAIPADG